MIPKILKESFFELENVICTSKNSIEKELKFTQRLKKYPHEYAKGVRPGILGKLLEKDKGEQVHWFETNAKDKETGGYFSIVTPLYENINLQAYKNLLLDKLKDTLEISGFDAVAIKQEIINRTLPINSYN
jgi:hypothetical protein